MNIAKLQPDTAAALKQRGVSETLSFDADDVFMTIGANFEDQQEDLAACLPHGGHGNPESSRTAAFNVA